MKEFFSKVGAFLTKVWSLWNDGVPTKIKYVIGGAVLVIAVIFFIKWCL